MKQKHTIIPILVAGALLAVSCSDIVSVPGETVAEGKKASYDFYVSYGDCNGTTKAMTENAQVKNMYVAVFDDAGYKLSEYVKAELVAPVAGTNGTKYKYNIQLTVSSSKRILHFIANAPAKLTYGSESEVIGSLYTSLSNDDVTAFQESYWQRVEMPHGIPAEPLPGASSEEVTAYQDAAELLNNIELIRNYSKITLTQKEIANFSILGMWFVNYPDRGTVAPYNRNNGEFMTDYLTYTNVGDIEATGTDMGNYQGFMLATTQFKTPTVFNETTSGGYYAVSDGKAVGYVYEREKALDSPMYLIIKASFDGDECYYKVALQNSKGEFYSMLRNFNYLVEIQSVARKGEATAMDALKAAPSGDISMNMEYLGLTNIADGDARISVSQTSLVIVGEVGQKLDLDDILWFKYEPKVSGSFVIKNGDYDPTDPTTPGVVIDVSKVGASGAVIATSPSLSPLWSRGSEKDGLQYINISTTEIEKVHKTQDFTITGKYEDGGFLKTLTRTITLYLREYMTMDVFASPGTDGENNGHISNAINTPLTINIGIEQELPESMFPLDFKIEAARRTLTPNNDPMPVESGISTILDAAETDASGAKCKGHPSYWFVKTVTWEEYCAATPVNGKKYFTAKFKTNVADSNPEHVYVSQSYFKWQSVELKKTTVKTITGISLTPAILAIGDQATYSFGLSSVPSGGKVKIGLAGFQESPTSGSYTQKLTRKTMEQVTEGSKLVTYDIYEMNVTSGTNSFKLDAIQDGTGYVRIWANDYTPITTTATITKE